MSAPVRLGYIGLGNMGAPMAKRLVDWPDGVTVFDVRAEAMTPFAEAGAAQAANVADVAATDEPGAAPHADTPNNTADEAATHADVDEDAATQDTEEYRA